VFFSLLPLRFALWPSLASGGENVYKDDSISIEYVSADDKRRTLANDDAKLLPMKEATVNALATWIAGQVAAKLREQNDYRNIAGMEITLIEGWQRCCTVVIPLTWRPPNIRIRTLQSR
jgi:hypothetical protein